MEPDMPLVGLAKERRRLEQAVRRGESLLILGPPGAGKTALLRSAGHSAGAHAVCVRYRPALHDLLAAMATALIASRHPRFVKLEKNGLPPEKWAGRQTSVRLRGLLWSGLEADPRLLILDGVQAGSFPAYRFLQRLYHARGMQIIAAARDRLELGALQRLFWDPRHTIELPPLSDDEAAALFELAADRYHLRKLDLQDFRQRVLENARGTPGQIVEMCRMAADPRYLSGRHVLFAPLRIDVMTRFLP